MKIQKIILNLEGKSSGDLELMLDEAVGCIKDGYISASDRNDSGRFSFEVEHRVQTINPREITEEARYIAKQFVSTDDIDSSGMHDDLGKSLIDFAKSPDGLDLDEFNEHIEGDIASMIQVIIDEYGGVDNGGDDRLAEKLSEYFDLHPRIKSLRNTFALRDR